MTKTLPKSCVYARIISFSFGIPSKNEYELYMSFIWANGSIYEISIYQ